MAVSKRTRFEVLRRDNYTCRYCRGTEGQLHVDHVTPVSLGGTDDPSNLVAACKDCNAGKASSSPDSETVTQVTDDAMRWAAALKQAATEMESGATKHSDLAAFYDFWTKFKGSYDEDLPKDWEASVLNFMNNGMTLPLLQDAAVNALTRKQVAGWHKFRYFCGICWKVIGQMREDAERIIAEGSE